MSYSHPQLDPRSNSGPFRADQLRDGDRYELSDGHPLYCAPAGPDHATGNIRGAAVLDSDPEVEWAGIDAGFSPEPGMLRAPDVAVGAPRPSSRWMAADILGRLPWPILDFRGCASGPPQASPSPRTIPFACESSP